MTRFKTLPPLMGRLFPDGTRRPLRAAALLMGLLAAAGDAASPAFALSDLQTIPGDAQQQTPAGTPEGQAPAAGPTPQAPAAQAPANPGGSIPRPDPLVAKPPAAASGAKPAEAQPKPVEVLTDISKIPAPVARMRQLIVEAAASGDVERLRALLGKGPTQTVIGDNEEEDPIEAIKGLSGDSDGLEILAIMLDLLSTGFVKMDAGTPDEVYVWPYFVAKPLASLTPPEKVDLMRLVTAGDVMAMQEFGSYNFYRIGISPDGQWKFLSGGD